MSLKEKLAEKEKEKANSIGNSWRPAEGEVIEGIVGNIGDTITDYGEQSYIEITGEAGKVIVWLNSILNEQVEKEDVKRGDHVAIKFLGLKKSKKSNRRYKDYVLVKEG